MKTPNRKICFILVAFTVTTHASHAMAVEFAKQIKPLIESACLHCHNQDNAEGDLRLETRELALTGGSIGPALVPGKPNDSPLYTLCVLSADDDEIMPPVDEGPLTKSQTELLKAWIEEGAKWPEDLKLEIQPRIDFVKHIQPIFEQNCLSCHRSDNAEGDLDLSTRAVAFETGFSSPNIVPFEPEESLLYAYTVLEKDADELMPPANAGGPLKSELTDRLRLWIAQGALWPEELKLEAKAKTDRPDSPDNLPLIAKIHSLIVERSKEQDESQMADYASKVPLTKAAYHMVAINGGEFMMGSPANEAHRSENEGPQTKVKVSPFWMGKYEVTWDEYEPYMITQVDRHKHGGRTDYDPNEHSIVDAVSQPTAPYTEMSFGMGQLGYPAISMTQHAANKYCQWLSAQTGHFYRLPTEAEWEYACRAGTTTAFSFGDDMSKLGQYAWYYDNSNEKYQKVGLKKPNPWGLHDMHGNVMEWTTDKFEANYFTLIQKEPSNPFIKPERIYPRSVRGGNWDDDPENCRSAIRRSSAPEWKQQDPQLPKSIWYHTNAPWLGFRIVRPLKVPTIEEMHFYWNSATNKR